MGKNKIKKVLFLLKNGIGFGHFKRALVIANEIKNNGCEVVFIAQAKSFDIFKNKGFQVFNFPMVEQALNNNQQFIFYEMLNSLIEDINPDVILEDTYPDEYYLSLPAVQSRNKILILRRLNSEGIFNFTTAGLFNQYNKILVLQDKDLFIEKQKFSLNKLFLKSSKVKFFGDVFDKIEEIDLSQKASFCKSKEKLVVINCGAGGQQIGEDFVTKVFNNILSIIPDLQQGFNNLLKFVIITGPYTNINVDKNFLIKNNVEIHSYLKEMSTLLGVSDLNIIRPGYNTTLESLSGNANTILLPSISFMEDQVDWCDELKIKYGIDYTFINDLTTLKDLIVKNLKNKKNKCIIKNYASEVAQEIVEFDNCYKSKDSICFAVKSVDIKNSSLVTFNDIKNQTLLVEELKKINNNDKTLSFIGNYVSGIMYETYQKYFPENIINENVVDFYLLNSTNKNNIIDEILNLIKKGCSSFYFNGELDENDVRKIEKTLKKEGINLISLKEKERQEIDSLIEKYVWIPFEPYYKDLT